MALRKIVEWRRGIPGSTLAGFPGLPAVIRSPATKLRSVIPGFALAVGLAALVVAVWAFVLAALNRDPGRPVLVAFGVVEVLLVAQLVIGVVQLIEGGRPGNIATYLAYLIGALVIIPVGALWALAERSRSSTVILGIAGIAIAVMVLRLHEIWGGASV